MTTSVDHPAIEGTEALEELEEQLVATLNAGATCLLLSLGHRTGLLDALATSGPATAEQLASHARLDPRYVTEWLGGVTVADLVDHDPVSGTYQLPATHASLLTREGDANLAVFAQYVPMLGAVEDGIVEAFHEGGGVGYDAFPRFQAIMEEDSAQSVLAALDEHVLPLVPGLVDRLDAGIRVVDVGCGRGRVLLALAERFPASAFVGYDLAPDAVAHARHHARDRGLDNLGFEVLDATRLAEVEPAGGVQLVTTFDAIHDQAHPDALLRGIRHVLADDGVYLAQDIDGAGSHHADRDHPLGTLLYTVSLMHCMTVSLSAGGEGLGTMWGRPEARARLQRAGFARVEEHTFEHDVQNVYYVCRP
jgi:SAM-dependent methyltransferase